MSKEVVTIDVNDSMQDAMKRMKEKDIGIHSIERSKLQQLQ
jgi:predicted transcriptional regulator